MNIQLMNLIAANQEQFSHEFIEWLPDNLHVWTAFEAETKKIIRAGFKYYSARTIVHVLRHHSALREVNGEWKINNNHSPYLARLFVLVHPLQAHIFKCRQTPKADRDNGPTLNNEKLFA